jgi:hypothetical protein
VLWCDFCGRLVDAKRKLKVLHARSGVQVRWCGECPRPRHVPLFEAPPISVN